MKVFVQLLRVATFLLGVVQLLWITRYVYEVGGVIGVFLAWLAFPLTLMISPIYGVLAHGDWLGVLLVALGPITFVALGRLGASRIGDDANHRDWGPEPMRDVVAGVDALVAGGLADPDRLGASRISEPMGRRFKRRSRLGGNVVSQPGAFGAGTGLVLALHEQMVELDESGWRVLATDSIASVGTDDSDAAYNAAKAIEQSAASEYIGGALLSLMQAHRWTVERTEERLASLPDTWFTGTMRDGRAAVPSGVKVVLVNNFAVAALGLAAMAFAPSKDVAETVAPLSSILDLDSLLVRAGTIAYDGITN